jgi:segregation and condensation protein B
MTDLKAKVEAVLFMTAKPVKAAAVARIVNADVQAVRQMILELIRDYEERKGGLEITDDNGYSIQVRDEYSRLVEEFAPVEMSQALLRTLSAIAIKQPVQQSDVIKIRGQGAYDHIRDLMERQLVSREKDPQGRSPMLTTTKRFQEYFRLSHDGQDLRKTLRKETRRMEKQTGDVPADGAELTQLPIPSFDPSEPITDFSPSQGSEADLELATVTSSENVEAVETEPAYSVESSVASATESPANSSVNE